MFYAEIKIFAGIHNQNRDLFEKGRRDWKTYIMVFFDMFEDDGSLTLALVKTDGEGKEFERHRKKEGAMFALFGEHIKNKRNDHDFMIKKLDDMNWRV